MHCYICIDVDSSSLAVKDMRSLKKKRNLEESDELDLFIQRYVPETGGYQDPEILPRRQLRILSNRDRLCTINAEDEELALVLTYNCYQGLPKGSALDSPQHRQSQSPQRRPFIRRLDSHNSLDEHTQESPRFPIQHEHEDDDSTVADHLHQNESVEKARDADTEDDGDATQQFPCPEYFEGLPTDVDKRRISDQTGDLPLTQEENSGDEITVLAETSHDNRTQETTLDKGEETQELLETSQWKASRAKQEPDDNKDSTLTTPVDIGKTSKGHNEKSKETIDGNKMQQPNNSNNNNNNTEKTSNGHESRNDDKSSNECNEEKSNKNDKVEQQNTKEKVVQDSDSCRKENTTEQNNGKTKNVDATTASTIMENLPKELRVESNYKICDTDSMTALSEVDEETKEESCSKEQENKPLASVEKGTKYNNDDDDDEVIDEPRGTAGSPFRRISTKPEPNTIRSQRKLSIGDRKSRSKVANKSKTKGKNKKKNNAEATKQTKCAIVPEQSKHDPGVEQDGINQEDIIQKDKKIDVECPNREIPVNKDPAGNLKPNSSPTVVNSVKMDPQKEQKLKKQDKQTSVKSKNKIARFPPGTLQMRKSSNKRKATSQSMPDIIEADNEPNENKKSTTKRVAKRPKLETLPRNTERSKSQDTMSPLSDRSGTQQSESERTTATATISTRKGRKSKDMPCSSQQSGSSSVVSRRRSSARNSLGKKHVKVESSEEVRIMFTKIEVSAEFKRVRSKYFALKLGLTYCIELCLLLNHTFQMIHKIGAELLEDIEDAVRATHFIAGDKKVSLKRTPKLMVGICQTSNILHADWLRESAKAGVVLSTDKYLLLYDQEAEDRYSFSMKETLRRGRNFRKEGRGFLDGISVLLCKGVAKNKAPTEKEFKLIVEAGGGRWLGSTTSTLKKVGDPRSIVIITSDPEILPGSQKKQLTGKEVKTALKNGAKCLSTTQFFDCVLAQTIF